MVGVEIGQEFKEKINIGRTNNGRTPMNITQFRTGSQMTASIRLLAPLAVNETSDRWRSSVQPTKSGIRLRRGLKQPTKGGD